jgi:predicted acyltransferase
MNQPAIEPAASLNHLALQSVESAVPTDESKSTRLISLDVFRGLTMMGMTIVNNPGSWSHVYPPLRHAEWNGWTITDLVFPFFIFIVGAAIPYALGKRFESDSRQKIYLKIVKRTAVMFLLGLVLAGFPSFNLETIRIMGVLQRLALCYFAASLIFLHTDVKMQAITALGCLAVYWLLMLIPPPDRETLWQTKDDNIAAWLDRTIFGTAHLWKAAKTWDPEGLLSTIPAIATALAGTLSGTWLRSPREPIEKAAGLFFAGVIALGIGGAMDWAFPINKNIWSPSYAVFMSGYALVVLAVCYYAIDVNGWKKWTEPFVVFGVNALLLFFASGMLARVVGSMIKFRVGDETLSLQQFIYKHLLASWAGEMVGSLLYPLLLLALWYVVLRALYKRNWIWKA